MKPLGFRQLKTKKPNTKSMRSQLQWKVTSSNTFAGSVFVYLACIVTMC